MKLVSTNQKSPPVTLREAVVQGIAPDGGLYWPESLKPLPLPFTQKLHELSLTEIAVEVMSHLAGDELSRSTITDIVEQALPFPAPLAYLTDSLAVLELFHGPTLAFKDFGACFMSRLLARYVAPRDKELTILVATSGDTGGAVARGFYKTEGIRVVLLYPKGKVSLLQEKQLTTLGENVTALEIEGTFDDCQRLVKEAFADGSLTRAMKLTSANSINIGRLLPQSFYYFSAWGQLRAKHGLDFIRRPCVFSVPSGNFGNLTAGLLAQALGLPVTHFVAATNANDVVPQYLATERFEPRPSVQTLSNAMDVGNPSNFARMKSLFGNSIETFRRHITGIAVSDEETVDTIRQTLGDFNYLLDPHGAVGFRALTSYFRRFPPSEGSPYPVGVVLETAHPAKFLDIVQPIAGERLEIPERLRWYLDREKQSVVLPADYTALKEFLLSFRR